MNNKNTISIVMRLLKAAFILSFCFNLYAHNAIELAAIWDHFQADNTGRDLSALTVDPLGCVYVADVKNNTIFKLSEKGEFITETGGYGWDDDQFDQPAGISAENGLDVFVADYMNQRIVRYDKKLNFLSTLKSDENLPGTLQFGYPKDVRISYQGELLLIDGENQRVLKFDVLGQPQISFGDYDDNEGMLMQPEKFIIVQDLIYITDSHLAKIVLYDIHGNYLRSVSNNQFKNLRGLAHHMNYLLVSDRDAKCLWILSEEGKVLQKIGPLLSKGIILKDPVDVAAYQNFIYLLDRSSSQILVFKWLGF